MASPSSNTNHLVEVASAWCASNGVLMGARDKETRTPLGNHIFEPAPFSLDPTPVPRSAFENAYKMAKPFNGVIHSAASHYEDWLRAAVKTAAEGDAGFTGKMMSLADEVIEMDKKGGVDKRAQNVALGILRSDYMLHGSTMDDAVPLQVEMNTIASSFGCLSTKISKLHKHLATLASFQSGNTSASNDLPDNGAADGIAAGLAAAVKEYVRQRDMAISAKENDSSFEFVLHPPVVVMVVQPGETNSVDQRDLEFLLLEKHGVRLIRRTLHDIASQGQYSGAEDVFCGRELLLRDDGPASAGMVAAAAVYYRAGYTPDDYPTSVEWEGRKKVEHSGAIKCPDIFYHLVGTKKVQQVLAEPGSLRQFCTSDDEASFLSSCFADLHALGEGDDSDAVSAALENPSGYVLKPQREGGGNNLYGEEMVAALKSMSYKERGAFILMQRIMPPAFSGKLVRRGDIVYDGECVCEIGVFGITLRRYHKSGHDAEDSALMNEVVGHILRTKSIETDEGGVAAGYAFLSSPQLV
uniref:Glutathione synthetase n=2 Tax=Pseudictyota dubia TaxID=2749911 RepID=A0A7R9W767_9STRA|mmetsp:Transcript_36066/g.66507  ORF Transcript_36066/g.66507 Transcript_36066/m.66507 type:complete len:525 (+) Transcript_36066:162-1736(+)